MIEIKTMKNSELEYAYRDSFLKRNKDFICVEVTLSLEYEDKEIIKNKEKYIYEETESSQEVLELLQSFFKSKR